MFLTIHHFEVTMNCAYLSCEEEGGRVLLDAKFFELDRVVQLDLLQDWQHDLERVYESILELEPRKKK